MSKIETVEEVDEVPSPFARSAANSRAKRALDIVAACAGLALVAPLLVLVAIAIRLETPGPVLFRQQRTGLYGRPFEIMKFRSMRVLEDGADPQQATRNDRRVTRVGAVIRALSIDELPQLVNVLKGDMSLVGPRPHAVGHDTRWAQTVPGYGRRFRTRPGLTGYAQIRGLRGEVLHLSQIRDRVAADNHYIENWSLALDLAIMLRTIPLLFADPRAY